MARKIIIVLIAGIFLAALLFTVYLNLSYQRNLPRSPQPNIGRTFPHNVHGSVVYLTESEKNQLDVLFWIDLVFFGVLGITVATKNKSASGVMK
ncbi:MAG: hypothetical protein WC091_03930 [Sulfuricellaceae bacterium]